MGEVENNSHQMPKLTMKQVQEKMPEKLNLSRLESWPPELAASTQSVLAKYHNVFSLELSKLGCTHSIKHVIKVTDDTPFKEWFRQIPLPLIEEVHKHLLEMLDSGAIHPSQSVWCNAVVLVRKKDGSLFFCIDLQHLNACTKDPYPLPRIKEALESLVGAGHFSCLEQKSGFWQIKMDESSKQNTMFTVGNLWFFKCNCMPFGLCNAPTTFQQCMQNCLGDLNVIYCLIYLDGIVVFLHTAEGHLHHLHVVFDQFREHNLKLKPSKCNIFREEITYLTHWISKEGVWPGNSILKAIMECAQPQTYMELHAFQGLVGHYRRFIKGFAHIAQPLHKHLTEEGARRKSEWVSFSENALKAFEALKQLCMTALVLAFANYTKPFLFKTDSSKDGPGVVLSQKQVDRQYHPVAYSSRALTPHGKNYHLTKLELLPLKWAVTEHFNEYLLYQPFLVKTDNNPLTYIMTTPNLDATGHWWVGAPCTVQLQTGIPERMW